MNWQQPDSLRAALDSVFAAPAYRWVQRPEHLLWLSRTWFAVRQWFRQLHERNPLAFNLVFYTLAALTIAIVLHAAWRFFVGVRSADTITSSATAIAARRDATW